MIKRDMVCEHLSLIQDAASILADLGALPLAQFLSDIRNPATAESYLRRALDAVFDVGRHLLAATGQVSLASEYKSTPEGWVNKRSWQPTWLYALS